MAERDVDLPTLPVLIRTWFGDDAAWGVLLQAVAAPSEDGFLASVHIVDDRAFAGFTALQLAAHHPGGAHVSFLADEATLSDPAQPILVVSLGLPLPGYGYRDLRPFRVVPAWLWAVENNLNLANMDWEEFESAAGPDGVFRGF